MTVSEDSVFLSCGTWSIMGIKVKEPITNDEAFELELTNEGTVDGKTKLLKNINGLWILQELQRYWSENGVMYSYEDLTKKAKQSKYNEIIDVEDEKFISRCNMYQTIKNDFIKRGIDPPCTVGDFVRVVINSLAEKYKEVMHKLEKITQKKFDQIHMVGGGIQNELLCEFTAQKTHKTIITGPTEASSFGNILSQLIALDLIKYNDIYSVVSNSIRLKEHR
nr:FGGY-family carbohydrate kinase [Mammaliicoccus lentus]